MTSDDARRVESLWLSLNEGGSALHRSVELLAQQDEKRHVLEADLQVLARGIEVLGKAAWVLHEQLIPDPEARRPVRQLNHNLVRLCSELDARGAQLGLAPLLCDGVTAVILTCCEEFAKGGRFRNTDELEEPSWSGLPPHLMWNAVQLETVRPVRRLLGQREHYSLCRLAHVAAVQRLERALCAHLRHCQEALWGRVVAGRQWIEYVERMEDTDLLIPVPLPAELARRGGGWACSCDGLDLNVYLYERLDERGSSQR